ncbi:MAG: rod shape-determining protein RodA [Clostridiales bacterium]|nr:rod shape-determining protein RodA [Clostridiales bacterium]
MNYFWNLLKNVDKFLAILPVFFAAFSIIMIASTANQGQFVFSSSVKTQITAYCIGFAAMIVVLFIDYHFYLSIEKILYAASILFLLSVHIPSLGHSEYGGARWINLGFTTFQPSELVKISMVLLSAMYISRNRDSLKEFKGVALSFLYAVPFIVIVLLEDLGSAVVMGFAWVVMVFFAGINYKLFAELSAATAFLIPVVYRFLSGTQKDRIDAFLNPDNLLLPGNWQVWQSKIAIGSGGLFGKGLFAGTQKKLEFLPVQKSDFIFSVIAEELGLLGGALLILLYTVFLYRILKIAINAKDLYGALVSMGFIGMFLFQIFENIAMTMGIMPVTGVTLPFISYGGSSILSCMVAVGLVLNIGIRNKIINFS